MITIRCVGNRRLDITRRTDNMYEVRIMLHRGKRDLRLATLVIPAEEFERLHKDSDFSCISTQPSV